MYTLAENIYMTGSPYHAYRGNHIIDNGLKSSIFVEDDDLRKEPIDSAFSEILRDA